MSSQDLFSPTSNAVLSDLRLEGKFCDAIIRVKDVEFKIHKIIMCPCSPYFQVLFSHWSTPSKKIYDIPGLSPKMMQLIIDFAYTGSVAVTERNVLELLLTADQFNVMGIVKICSRFLQERLNPVNCIHILHLTNISSFAELKRAAQSYIIDHFEEVMACEKLQCLSAKELADFLGRDNLNVAKESVVYEAVLRWVAHAPEQRRKHFFKLFSKVRLALFTTSYLLEEVHSNELVNCNSRCLQNIMEAIELTVAAPSDRASNPMGRPRLPRHVVLATGGDFTDAIEVYDHCANVWVQLRSGLEYPRVFHGIAYLDGSVYCMGGISALQFLNTMIRFDLSTRTWSKAAPMHYHRSFLSVAVLNGCIYVMGGSNNEGHLRTAERYTPENNQWSIIAEMHQPRSEGCSTTFNNRIYICGGFDGAHCLDTCEFYYPEADQWTMIASMEIHRCGVGVIAYAGRIFALGGFDGDTQLDTVESYDPGSDSWHPATPMLHARTNFGVFVINDQLFVAGGFSGFSCIPGVECYDAAADAWSEVDSMRVFRSGVSCCVVPRLPHMDNCVIPRDILPVVLAGDLAEQSSISTLA